ncbi:MAG: hypothetical protein HY895_02645 [Deltaproteobacteria bacterium]|nr:hypothetical protein [Deltaproteobacteria bacterium]
MKKIALLCLIALVGCSSARLIERNRDFRGYSLMQTRLIVPSDFSFKPHTATLALLTGEYVPVFEDGEGVYFQSPRGIIVDTAFYNGGVYLKNSPGDPAELWLSTYYSATVAVLPPEFKYEIVRR